jgi:hypothetical protein
VGVFVGSLAIQAPRTVDAYPTVVLEIDDLTRGRPPGVVVRELVYDRDDPAVRTCVLQGFEV